MPFGDANDLETARPGESDACRILKVGNYIDELDDLSFLFQVGYGFFKEVRTHPLVIKRNPLQQGPVVGEGVEPAQV